MRFKYNPHSLHSQIKYKKYESTLGKMNEAFDTISEYKREVSDLVPRHQRALSIVKEHVETVEIQREQYIQVRYFKFVMSFVMSLVMSLMMSSN